ncbi:MAG: peptidylprolyl isomerase [Rhodothermia bacterium]|nr:MAG: peptidylprolyl isomerase [Rhodothermia bacterium]
MRFTRALLLLFVLGSSALTTLSAHAQEGEVLDEIVVVVGDYIILKSDVDGYVLNAINQQQIAYSDELWQAALDQLIGEKVLVIHAKRDTNIVVTDEQVDQMLNSRIQQMSLQIGGDSKLEELYGKSIVEIRAEFREEFRDQLLADQIRGNKIRKIKATPADVDAWFQQFPTDSLPTLPDIVRVSHIVRKPEVTAEARSEAMEMITTIRDTVLTGAVTIEEMAELFSDDPGSASNGGLYENMGLSEVVPEFAAVASRAPLGLFSQIFETKFGLHFLRVNARRGDVIDYNHILIAFDERKNDPTPAIEFLTSLRDSVLNAGASFHVLARDHSEEETTASRGGRVMDPNSGERNLYLTNLGGSWQTTILQLEEGEISEPREVQLLDNSIAYHIVLLEKRIPEHIVNLETDYELVEGLALREKQGRIMTEWLNELKKDVYIDMRGQARDISIADN